MKEGTGIVLLGAGPEIHFALQKLHQRGVVKAFGCHELNAHNAQDSIDFCKEHGIEIIPSYKEAVSLNPRFIFMISYPPLISTEWLSKCKFVNQHGALIPRYRGMHGGTWALVNGEVEHGYSVHDVDEGIDSGPVYHQGIVKATIDDDINAIRKKILEKFSEEIEEVLMGIYEGKLVSIHQDESQSIHVCTRKPQDGVIDWDWSSKRIHDLIRSLAPPYTNGAFTHYKGDELYIHKSTLLQRPKYIGINGQVVSKLSGEGVLVKCGDTVLQIHTVTFRGHTCSADDLFKTVGARLGS